jgi:hypothetical protein
VEHRVERTGDQVGAVVEDFELDVGRQGPANLLELLLGRGDDAAAVFAADHHHHAGHRLAAAVASHGTLPGQRADSHAADVTDQDRHAPGWAADDHSRDVVDAAEQRLATDESLLAVLDDVAAAGARVVAVEGREHLAERDAVRRHAIGVDLDLIALRKAAVAVDVGHSRHRPHHRSHVPLQDAAEVHQASLRPAELELENLAECG